MAATQAESQQNEVNCEQVQQDQPPDLSNAVLQNGTEKNGGRGIVGSDSIINNKNKVARSKQPRRRDESISTRVWCRASYS